MRRGFSRGGGGRPTGAADEEQSDGAATVTPSLHSTSGSLERVVPAGATWLDVLTGTVQPYSHVEPWQYVVVTRVSGMATGTGQPAMTELVGASRALGNRVLGHLVNVPELQQLRATNPSQVVTMSMLPSLDQDATEVARAALAFAEGWPVPGWLPREVLWMTARLAAFVDRGGPYLLSRWLGPDAATFRAVRGLFLRSIIVLQTDATRTATVAHILRTTSVQSLSLASSDPREGWLDEVVQASRRECGAANDAPQHTGSDDDVPAAVLDADSDTNAAGAAVTPESNGETCESASANDEDLVALRAVFQRVTKLTLHRVRFGAADLARLLQAMPDLQEFQCEVEPLPASDAPLASVLAAHASQLKVLCCSKALGLDVASVTTQFPRLRAFSSPLVAKAVRRAAALRWATLRSQRDTAAGAAVMVSAPHQFGLDWVEIAHDSRPADVALALPSLRKLYVVSLAAATAEPRDRATASDDDRATVDAAAAAIGAAAAGEGDDEWASLPATLPMLQELRFDRRGSLGRPPPSMLMDPTPWLDLVDTAALAAAAAGTQRGGSSSSDNMRGLYLLELPNTARWSHSLPRVFEAAAATLALVSLALAAPLSRGETQSLLRAPSFPRMAQLQVTTADTAVGALAELVCRCPVLRSARLEVAATAKAPGAGGGLGGALQASRVATGLPVPAAADGDGDAADDAAKGAALVLDMDALFSALGSRPSLELLTLNLPFPSSPWARDSHHFTAPRVESLVAQQAAAALRLLMLGNADFAAGAFAALGALPKLSMLHLTGQASLQPETPPMECVSDEPSRATAEALEAFLATSRRTGGCLRAVSLCALRFDNIAERDREALGAVVRRGN